MFTRVRLPGLWILGSVVSPAEFEHVDDYSGALDSAGGTYALGAALILGGAGVHLSGTSHHVLGSATLTVDSLGSIVVASGAMIKLDGTGSNDIELKVVSNVASINVKANARIDVQESADVDVYGAITLKDNGGASGSGGNLIVEDTALITVQSGGVVSAAAGSTVNLNGVTHVRGNLIVEDTASGGPGSIVMEGDTLLQVEGTTLFVDGSETTFQGATTWPLLSPARTWHRAAKELIPLTFDGGGSDGTGTPDAWVEQSNINPPVPCWRTLATATSGGTSLLVFDDLPQGGEIDTVEITCRGTISIDNNDLPTYRIVRWKDSAAATFTYVSNIKTDDAHTDDDFFFVTGTTTVTANASQTIDNQYRYGLLITHPFRTGSTQGMRIYDAQINGTSDILKV